MSQLVAQSGSSLWRAISRLAAVIGQPMPTWRPPARTKLRSTQTELLSTMTTAEWADLPTWHPASPED